MYLKRFIFALNNLLLFRQMKKNILLLCAFCFLIPGFFTAQENYEKHFPSLTLGVSAIKFTGDVGKGTDVNPLLDTRLGYYISLEQRFGKVFGISLGGLYGKLAGYDFSKISKRNFESIIMQGEILITANFDKVIKADPTVSPFINAGIGYMLFDPYGDLKKGNIPYNYWSDGSIRDLPEIPANFAIATTINRDYTYETQLKDSLKNYARNTLIIPFGGGLNFHMGKRWTASLGINYALCLSDYIDNYKNGGNDSYLQANVGIQFEFKSKEKKKDKIDFNEVDHFDADGDGIGDDKDRCLGTPKGVPVDKFGCPFDTDEDGVADYMDKEPNSAKRAKVDGFGVTFNEDSLAKHQLEWDSLYTVRSEGFNETPSKEYLEKIENNSMTNNSKGKSSGNKIPSDLLEADLNKDGFVSAEEITKTIDAFFEGTNDFTVEKINRLIDYFFEQ